MGEWDRRGREMEGRVSETFAEVRGQVQAIEAKGESVYSFVIERRGIETAR